MATVKEKRERARAEKERIVRESITRTIRSAAKSRCRVTSVADQITETLDAAGFMIIRKPTKKG